MDVVHDDRASINEEEEEDRISNLPDDILYNILSFVDMKYAIQTSTLSKRWKHIWTSMPYLNLNNQTFGTFPQFSEFVKHALSRRNHHTEVSAVKLSFTGSTCHFTPVVKRIVKYAFMHNIRHLTIIWFSSSMIYNRKFPQCRFSSRTLKHLTLAIDTRGFYEGRVPIPAWDFPALETLNLRNMQLSDSRGTGDNSLNIFSKCVNLKDITLYRCSMNHLDVFNVCAPQLSKLTIETLIFEGSKPNLAWDFPALETLKLSKVQLNDIILDLLSKCVNLKDLTLHRCFTYGDMDAFNICAPQLSNLTITDPIKFPKVFNVVAPQLKNLTASVNTIEYRSDEINFLQLSIEGLNSLEKVNLHMSRSMHIQEIYVPQLLNLFHKLRSAKFLILDLYIIQALSSCMDQLSHESCPFNNLKSLKINKQKESIVEMPAEVRNYFLESSPSVTFIIDDLPQVPQKRSWNEVDKGTMAKKSANSNEDRQQTKTITLNSRSSQEALSSCPDQLPSEPSSFNNLKRLNQPDPIPRMPTEVRNHLFESSSSATSTMDLSQVPNKRSRKEVDNNTMINKLEKEKQQIEIVAGEKRMLEAKMCTQDELIEEQKVMLEAMKLQHEKRMVEAKILMQDKIIARQKEAMKLQHENEMLEEKRRLQEEVIEDQKAMLEMMRLQNEKRMFEAKIQKQDEIVAQQKVMLEAMKLQHEQIEIEQGNIDS